MAEIELRGASKRFGRTVAVDNVSLVVPDGTFAVLLGPTGAGKTTLLRLVAGLEAPDSGEVRIGGAEMTAAPPAARNVAFVFQSYSLYPHMSVYDNLAFPLRSPARRMEEGAIRRRVGEIAAVLQIGDKLSSRPADLSGGQMQRIAIGRALVREPAVFLMDEPLSSLDAKLREDLRLELRRLHMELGATILYVTHDQTEAMTLADHIGVLREGRMVQFGPPREIYEAPANAYVASKLGEAPINLLPAGTPNLPPAPAEAATIGIRPENIRLRGEGGLPAKVVHVETLGGHRRVRLLARGMEILAYAGDSRPRTGDEVSLTVRAAIFFDNQGRSIGAWRNP